MILQRAAITCARIARKRGYEEKLGGLLGVPQGIKMKKFEQGWVIRDEGAHLRTTRQTARFVRGVLKRRDLCWLLR